MKKLILILCIAILLCGCTKTVNEVQPSAEPVVTVSEVSPTPSPTIAPTPVPKESPISPMPKPSATPSPSQEAAEVVADTVKISITGVDDNAEILPLTEVAFEQGQTVFDILLNVTKQREIQMEYSGSKKNAYIKGINNLYEFDKGSMSGWLYSVNGTIVNKGCGAYTVEKGDVIEWIYSIK